MENDSHFHYFAYASNLKTSVLEDRIGDKVLDNIQGRLIDYGFRFNKKNEDGSARANILISESEDVFGVIYQIGENYREILLSTEPGYRLIRVSVENAHGAQEAFTFISDEDAEGIRTKAEYVNTILQGAKEHALPEEYVDFIKSLTK